MPQFVVCQSSHSPKCAVAKVCSLTKSALGILPEERCRVNLSPIRCMAILFTLHRKYDMIHICIIMTKHLCEN